MVTQHLVFWQRVPSLQQSRLPVQPDTPVRTQHFWVVGQQVVSQQSLGALHVCPSPAQVKLLLQKPPLHEFPEQHWELSVHAPPVPWQQAPW